jgi:hypothetical protein
MLAGAGRRDDMAAVAIRQRADADDVSALESAMNRS